MSSDGAVAHNREMDERELTDVERHENARAGIVVSVRLKADEAMLLRGLAERDGRTLSETLRVALHAFARAPAPTKVSTPGADSPTRGPVVITDGSPDVTFVG